MEARERDLILRVLVNNPELRRLYEEHESLESRIAEYEGRPYLTADEEMEQKRLKKIKLRGVDRMMEIVSPDPEAEAAMM